MINAVKKIYEKFDNIAISKMSLQDLFNWMLFFKSLKQLCLSTRMDNDLVAYYKDLWNHYADIRRELYFRLDGEMPAETRWKILLELYCSIFGTETEKADKYLLESVEELIFPEDFEHLCVPELTSVIFQTLCQYYFFSQEPLVGAYLQERVNKVLSLQKKDGSWEGFSLEQMIDRLMNLAYYEICLNKNASDLITSAADYTIKMPGALENARLFFLLCHIHHWNHYSVTLMRMRNYQEKRLNDSIEKMDFEAITSILDYQCQMPKDYDVIY